MAKVISARVLREMGAAILSGQIKPRERLIEIDLIARFGGSRTVIREAMKKPDAEGLVRTIPYGGAIEAGNAPRAENLTLQHLTYFQKSYLAQLKGKTGRPGRSKESDPA